MAACVCVDHRGKTMLSGISIARFAQEHAHQLAATDKMLARYVEDLSGMMQLIVAGCLRTLDETTSVLLCSSPLGSKALRHALSGKCQVVVSLPQVQHVCTSCRSNDARAVSHRSSCRDLRFDLLCSQHVNLKFAGRDEVDDQAFEIDDLKSKQAWDKLARWFGMNCARLLLLPAVAVYPPLQNNEFVPCSPRFRYWLYESSAIAFYLILIFTKLPIFRHEPYWPRDYGLIVWTFMELAHSVHFIFISGVEAFFEDIFHVTEIVGDVLCVTALILNLCGGDESFSIEIFIFGLEASEFSCSDVPATVPLSASQVLSIAVLLKGLLLLRVIRTDRKYGPLLLMVEKMVVDSEASWNRNPTLV